MGRRHGAPPGTNCKASIWGTRHSIESSALSTSIYSGSAIILKNMLHTQHTKVKSTLDFVRVTVEILILGGVYGVGVRPALKMRATPFPCPNATLIWLRNLPSERHHRKNQSGSPCIYPSLEYLYRKAKELRSRNGTAPDGPLLFLSPKRKCAHFLALFPSFHSLVTRIISGAVGRTRPLTYLSGNQLDERSTSILALPKFC